MSIPCLTIIDHEGNEINLDDFKKKFQEDESYRASFNKAKYKAEEKITSKTTSVGVSHKALTSSAKDIGIEAPKRGEGSTRSKRERKVEELRNDLPKANQLVNDFLASKKQLESEGREDEISASPKQVAAGKAILEDLNKQRDEARDNGNKSAVEELNKKIFEQHKISKQIATASHMTFAEHQGEVSLNTDSESAMENAAEAKSNKVITDKEREEAKSKAKKSKETGEELGKLSKEKDKEITKRTKGVKSTIENPREYFADKDSKDLTFTLEEVKAVWDVFKGHLDSTKSLKEAYKNTMQELNLTMDQVTHAIASPKTKGKNIDQEMLIAQARRRSAVEGAKRYIRDINASKTNKFLNKAYDFVQALKIVGHGFTAPITHAALMVYRNPLSIKTYLKFVKQTYKFGAGGAFSKEIRAEYEKTMMDMELDPLYEVALKSGVAASRNMDYSPDESINRYINLKERLKVGERGFDMLKPYRLELFKVGYEKLTTEQRENPAILEQLARDVNMGTGTIKFTSKIGKASDVLTNKVFWSFRLQAAKVNYTFIDPIDVTANLVKSTWKELTPEEKYKNKLVLNRTAWLLVSGFGSLLANQALLSATGSKDNVNFSDPEKDDWLAYKIGGESIPLLKNPLFVYKMISACIKNHINGGVKVNQNDLDIVAKEIRYKLHPTLGLIWDVKTGSNAIGQVNPWTSNEEAMSSLSEENPRLTWNQWVSQQGPIPISEAERGITDRMREQGMSDKEIVGFLNNFLDYGVKTLKVVKDVGIGLTGLKVQDAKTNKRTFDNGNIPSKENQIDTYKNGTQSERDYLDRNIAKNITEQIKELYDKKFDSLKEDNKKWEGLGKNKEAKVALEVVKDISKENGEYKKILKTYQILPSEVSKYVETTLTQEIKDKKINEGEVSKEAKPYAEMSKSNVNDAFVGKLRDIMNEKSLLKRRDRVSKLLPLIQELHSMGQIDDSVIRNFTILYVKGNVNIE